MNLFWNGRRTEGRSSLDAARLQAALTEELNLLARLYRSNLDLLDRAEVRLLSTRVPLAIFRANVPRLTLLEEDAIRCLVAVHANNEHIEMMVAERAKTIKNGQCTIYVFEKDDPPRCSARCFRTAPASSIARSRRSRSGAPRMRALPAQRRDCSASRRPSLTSPN